MPFCRNCGKDKSEEEFNWRWKALGIRQPICKDCTRIQRRKHNVRHQEEEKKRTYEVTRQQRDRARLFIYEYLSTHPCVDCGEYDFAVLTFDHVIGEKKMEVSRMVSEGYSIEAIMDEISKCEVVCFNCHMRRESNSR